MMSPSGFPLKLSFYQSIQDFQVHYGTEYDINTYSPNSDKTRQGSLRIVTGLHLS